MGSGVVFFDRAEAEDRRFVAVNVGLVRSIPPGEWAREQAELTRLAESVAPDPTVFDQYKPWFWRMIASTDREDSYSTKMMPSSLRNYAQDYSEGRAFLIGHDKRVIPSGYSLRGKFVAGQGGGVPRTEVDLYALQGLDFVDNAVVSMRGGTLRDASISFSGGRWICSIDGQDMLRASWDDCWHFPGVWYRKEGAKKKEVKPEDMVKCVAFVEDSHAHELSGVYDGATPGAGMVKALRAAEAGLLDKEQRIALESQYRMTLPGTQLFVPGTAARASGEEERMDPVEGAEGDAGRTPEPATPPVTPPVVDRQADPAPQGLSAEFLATMVARSEVAEVARVLGIEPGADAIAALRTFATTTLPTLRTEAEAGRAYRTRLAADIKREGIRALGDKYVVTDWDKMIADTREVATLEAYRDNFAKMAGSALPNGRATVDGPQSETPAAPKDRTPDWAYKG